MPRPSVLLLASVAALLNFGRRQASGLRTMCTMFAGLMIQPPLNPSGIGSIASQRTTLASAR
jgi:hypothetical protein